MQTTPAIIQHMQRALEFQVRKTGFPLTVGVYSKGKNWFVELSAEHEGITRTIRTESFKRGMQWWTRFTVCLDGENWLDVDSIEEAIAMLMGAMPPSAVSTPHTKRENTKGARSNSVETRRYAVIRN